MKPELQNRGRVGMEPARAWQTALAASACLLYCLGPWLAAHLELRLPGPLLWLMAIVAVAPSLPATVRHARARGWRWVGTGVLTAAGIVVAQELVWPLIRRALVGPLKDPNPDNVIAMFGGNVGLLVVMVVFVGPFVEEALYRFGVFRPLCRVHPVVAYAVVGALFGLQHVLPTLLTTGDPRSWANIGGYVIAGLLFCWAYRREGTLAAPYLAHVLGNAPVVFML